MPPRINRMGQQRLREIAQGLWVDDLSNINTCWVFDCDKGFPVAFDRPVQVDAAIAVRSRHGVPSS